MGHASLLAEMFDLSVEESQKLLKQAREYADVDEFDRFHNVVRAVLEYKFNEATTNSTSSSSLPATTDTVSAGRKCKHCGCPFNTAEAKNLHEKYCGNSPTDTYIGENWIESGSVFESFVTDVPEDAEPVVDLENHEVRIENTSIDISPIIDEVAGTVESEWNAGVLKVELPTAESIHMGR